MLFFHLASKKPSDRSFCIYKYARTIHHDFPLVLPLPTPAVAPPSSSSPFDIAHRKCERGGKKRKGTCIEKKRETTADDRCTSD